MPPLTTKTFRFQQNVEDKDHPAVMIEVYRGTEILLGKRESKSLKNLSRNRVMNYNTY